jgi:hypothetical protein
MTTTTTTTRTNVEIEPSWTRENVKKKGQKQNSNKEVK